MGPSLLFSREDQRLYKVWVKFTEKEVESQKQSMTVEREAAIDPDNQVLLPSSSASSGPLEQQGLQPGHDAKGKGRGGKGHNTLDPKTEKKEPKEKKQKTPAQQTKQVRFLAQLKCYRN